MMFHSLVSDTRLYIAAWKMCGVFILCFCSVVSYGLPPELLKDINPGAGSSYLPFSSVPVGYQGSILFAAGDDSCGNELWLSDGTNSGTTRVSDIRPGPASSTPGQFTLLGNRVVFAAVTDANGYELWVTDGTDIGTTIIKDIFPGTSTSDPRLLGVGNGSVILIADDGEGIRFWKTDGTSINTVPISGDYLPEFTQLLYGEYGNLNGEQYAVVVSHDYDDAWLYKTNGQSVTLVKEFLNGIRGPHNFLNHNGFLYFKSQDYLWRTDGTTGGTVPLGFIGATLGLFAGLDGTVLMNATAGVPVHELYKWDGTAVSLIKDIYGGFGQSRPKFATSSWLGHMFFEAQYSGVQKGLWITDGSTEGTRLYYDWGFSSDPWITIASDRGAALIVVTTAQYGRELWITYSPNTPPQLLYDFNPGPASSNPVPFKIGNDLYMFADDGIHGAELWKLNISTEAAASDWQHFH